MKKYLYDYIKSIDKILKSDEKVNYKKLREEHLVKIEFFQHERFIHLIVTMFYALFTFIFFFFSETYMPFMIIVVVLMIFLAFYVVHYFRLENGVQYLYKQYDEIEKKLEK